MPKAQFVQYYFALNLALMFSRGEMLDARRSNSKTASRVICTRGETRWLSCKMLQDSCKNGYPIRYRKFFAKGVDVVRSCKKNGYLVWFLQVRSGSAALLLVRYCELFFIYCTEH